MKRRNIGGTASYYGQFITRREVSMVAAILVFCICGTVAVAMLAQAFISVHEADVRASREPRPY